MYTIDELRRAMADETAELTTRLTHADIRAAAARRRFRNVFAGLAVALVPALAAGAVVALSPGGPGPSPEPTIALRPSPIVSWEPDASPPPPAGPTVRTGLAFGADEEIVLWYQDQMNGVMAGLLNRKTGKVRHLDFGVNVPGKGVFGTVLELDDRNGGIVDYGIFGAGDARIRVTAGGRSTQASTAAIPGIGEATLFWVRRAGVIAGPTGAVGAPSPDAVFTAFDAAGRTIATVTPSVQRNDGAVDRYDGARQIGELMRTGLTAPDGGELVFWCDGDQHAATLHAGSDDRHGTVTRLRDLGSLNRPPFASGFYGGYNTFPLAGGGTAVAAIYVGDAATVELRGAGGTAGASHGSAAWSVHPQLRVLWATGISGSPTAVARDAGGKVLVTTDFS